MVQCNGGQLQCVWSLACAMCSSSLKADVNGIDYFHWLATDIS